MTLAKAIEKPGGIPKNPEGRIESLWQSVLELAKKEKLADEWRGKIARRIEKLEGAVELEKLLGREEEAEMRRAADTIDMVEIEQSAPREMSHGDHMQEVAAQCARNADYYRSLLEHCGDIIGKEAYVPDDGSVQEDVLCAKIPELVSDLVIENKKLKGSLRGHYRCGHCGYEAYYEPHETAPEEPRRSELNPKQHPEDILILLVERRNEPPVAILRVHFPGRILHLCGDLAHLHEPSTLAVHITAQHPAGLLVRALDHIIDDAPHARYGRTRKGNVHRLGGLLHEAARHE